MEHPDLISLFVAPLNQIGAPYMVTGAIAAGAYSSARFTNDIDLVLILSDTDARQLHAIFDTPDFYVPPLEVIQVERNRPIHGHFNVIHIDSGFKADFYFAGSDRLNRRALERRRRETDASGEAVWLAPPEYVILSKLQYLQSSGSEKHIPDIQGILRVQGDSLDRDLLEREVQALGLQAAWARVVDNSPL